MNATSETMPADGAATETSKKSKPKGSFFSQLWKYGGVSFTQNFVELGVFLALEFAGLAPRLANVFAIIASGSYNYLMNRNITFKASGNYLRSVLMFIALYCWNLIFCNVMLTVLPGITGWGPEIIKLITMGCQGCWGFLLCRYVIFR